MNFNRFKDSISNSSQSSYDKTLKVYRVILVILILLILAVTTYTISYELAYQKSQNPQTTKSTPNFQDIQLSTIQELSHEVTVEHEYMLKDSNGKVAVFKVGEFEPFMVLEVFTNTLPYLDRQNLMEGILVVGDDNLRSIIEDFDS